MKQKSSANTRVCGVHSAEEATCYASELFFIPRRASLLHVRLNKYLIWSLAWQSTLEVDTLSHSLLVNYLFVSVTDWRLKLRSKRWSNWRRALKKPPGKLTMPSREQDLHRRRSRQISAFCVSILCTHLCAAAHVWLHDHALRAAVIHS